MLLPRRKWKDIEGYEGLYQVSNLGEVRSLNYRKKNITRKMKIHTKITNYQDIQLSKNGKTQVYLIHRLVAEAFIPNPNNFPQINHRDENPKNNIWTNLEWCTAKYNCNYGNHKINISKANKGKVFTKDHKLNISKAKKGIKIWQDKVHPMTGKTGEKHHFYGKHHTEETKIKLSNIHKGLQAGEKHPMYGKHLSEETKRKISESKIGSRHTEETKRKISESHKGLQVGEKNPMYGRTGEKNPNAQAIICITTGEIFTTVSEAAEYGNTYRSNIAKQIQGKIKSAGKHPITGEKLTWKYVG